MLVNILIFYNYDYMINWINKYPYLNLFNNISFRIIQDIMEIYAVCIIYKKIKMFKDKKQCNRHKSILN